jgi:proteasome lid subunit RPN8/RPN11
MSETSDLTYAALITISIPGRGESVGVTVKLSAADAVPAGGQSKALADCTLADLQAYATELEKDVWDAYEAIKLPALDEDEHVQFEVAMGSDPTSAVEEWTEQVLLLPALEQEDSDVDTEGEDAPPVVSAGEEEPAFLPDELTVAEINGIAEVGVEDSATSSESPDVAVAETELVYPEIEEEVAEKAEAVPEPRTRVPEIIPSKARVRVAGKQFPLGHPTWAAVDILIDEPALRATQAHALSSMDREVAGVLVGPRPEKQPDGRYLVHIIDMIVARHTVMQGASVTYTPESWRYLNDTLMHRYPDDTVVMAGWYHTHPGFGIFLSGMDLFIHQNFFTQIWHVALVLDPRARMSGFFCWDRPKSRVSRYDFAWPSWAAGSW